jgi:glycopeptide antibiotics resistance protein
MRFPQAFVVPWFVPGVILSVVVGVLFSGPLARALHTRRVLAWAVVASVGLVLSATLTPLREAIDFGATGSRACDFSRIGLAPLSALLRMNDTSLNVLMLVPLGVSLGLLPRSRPKVVLVVAAIGLPFAVETAQLLLPFLDRACQSADVVDNLTGLVVGLVIGTGAGILASWTTPPPRNEDASDPG